MRLDPATAPGEPALTASVITGQEDFPRTVLRERHPELLDRVLSGWPYPPEIRSAVRALAEEIEGPILPLTDGCDDAADWAAWSAPYLGRSWYEVPFLWAENYFYRKLLGATGWFEPGPWERIDPFGPQKDAELTGDQVRSELDALAALEQVPAGDLLDTLVLTALWGNRADLGFQLQRPDSTGSRPTAGPSDPHLIVDDRQILLPCLSEADRIILVADNVGGELVPDLVLADRLLTRRPSAEVSLHVKPRPYFTSDATPRDVLKTVQHMIDGPHHASLLGERLRQFLVEGRLAVFVHPFYVAPLTFSQAPDDLQKLYAEADLTVLKGDLNYRRLIGDAAWPATTPFESVAGYWPGHVAALRTLKSDVLVGLSAQRLTELDESGEKWRTSGDYAIIQAR